MVTLAEDAAAEEPQGGVRQRADAAAGAAARRHRADRARRVQRQGRQARRRMAAADPRFPLQRRDPQFRQRQGGGALQPGRCRDAGHHHPHQELAAPGAAAGAGKIDEFAQATRAAASRLHRQLQVLFRPPERPRRRHQNDARSAAARRAGAGPRPVRARRAARRMRRIAADLAEAAIECITDAEAIGRFQSISEADMFDVEYWSLEQAKLGQARPLPLAGQVVAITGAGGAIGAATAKAFAAAGAEVALLDIDLCRGPEGRCRHRRRRRWWRPATSPTTSVETAFDADRAGVRRRRHRRVERRRGLAGPHRRGRRSDAAQELRAEFLRPPARRAGRGEDHAGSRAPAAACCSTSRSRR